VCVVCVCVCVLDVVSVWVTLCVSVCACVCLCVCVYGGGGVCDRTIIFFVVIIPLVTAIGDIASAVLFSLRSFNPVALVKLTPILFS